MSSSHLTPPPPPAASPLGDRRAISEIVLIVDDVPDNLALLHDALDEAGYTVLVATHGEAALQRARQSLPDIILLDAMMPGMDGFEVARRLKADTATRAIPIVFMTGLTETEHVVAAFQAGGTDYVTKPLKPLEVLARIAAHLQNARQMRQARSALDAFGQATVAISRQTGRLTWQTPLARRMLLAYFSPARSGEESPPGDDPAELPPPEFASAPARLMSWVQEAEAARAQAREPNPLLLARPEAEGGGRLLASLHDPSSAGHEGEWLVVLREENDAATVETLIQAFRLTQKEAEVLYWVILGKTSKDIGDILGSSPRTVNKHLEHVFEKLGVETRTAAAALATARLQGRG